MEALVFFGLIFSSVTAVYCGEYCTDGTNTFYCSMGCCQYSCCETIVIGSTIGGAVFLVIVGVVVFCCSYRFNLCCFKKLKTRQKLTRRAGPNIANGQAHISSIPHGGEMKYPQGPFSYDGYQPRTQHSYLQQPDINTDTPPPRWSAYTSVDNHASGRSGPPSSPHPQDSRWLQRPPYDNVQQAPPYRCQVREEDTNFADYPWQLKPHPLTSSSPNLADKSLFERSSAMNSPMDNVCKFCNGDNGRSQYSKMRSNAYVKRLEEYDRRSQYSGMHSNADDRTPAYCTRCGGTKYSLDGRPRPASFSPLYGASGDQNAYYSRGHRRVPSEGAVTSAIHLKDNEDTFYRDYKRDRQHREHRSPYRFDELNKVSDYYRGTRNNRDEQDIDYNLYSPVDRGSHWPLDGDRRPYQKPRYDDYR